MPNKNYWLERARDESSPLAEMASDVNRWLDWDDVESELDTIRFTLELIIYHARDAKRYLYYASRYKK